MSTPAPARVRRRLQVTGLVQGVGFRPFAHRLATDLGLAGVVRNDARGACIEIEGPPEAVDRFAARLVTEAPPLARIESVRADDLPPAGGDGFAIAPSDAPSAAAHTLVPPDTATCPACLAEVDDPADRRYRHPFANCTDCGPRFTVITGLPYDRPQTTMAPFAMCPACRAEYADPADRRHHAQPICCPDCGPRLRFVDGPDEVAGDDAAVAAVQAAWAAGRIVAVKGLGGYHLTCDAADDDAVARLRERKGRAGKPFAVLAPDLATARRLARLTPAAEASLAGPARPIVLARRTTGAPVSAHVAPGNPDLGVMLPSSALHHLLLRPVPGADVAPPAAIVATSGNRSGEPLCTDDDEARARLGDLADAFLVHDREIALPCDDSVVRVVGDRELPVRRSRGYAPLPLRLPFDVAPTLALGGELKATFCLAEGRRAWMSQHIGDVENLETLQVLERAVAAFRTMYRIAPQVIAADRHPGYLSRRWAHEQGDGMRVVEVQHHHAHAAALMAEHGLDGETPLVALVFDGTGYGPAAGGRGAAAWGGELLVAGYTRCVRAGRLRELPLPGGDAGVRNPCRTAIAYLSACGLALDERLAPVRAADAVERRVVARQVQTGTGIVPTTSMGRLFDVVASLLDVRHRVTYEGQAAIELEGLAAAAAAPAPGLRLDAGDDGILDPGPLLAALVRGMDDGTDRAALALGFHHAVAEAAADLAARTAADEGLTTAGLTGGVFQNTLLAGLCRDRLQARDVAVLEHRSVPAGDGGLALGQAIIAGHPAGATTSWR